MLSQYARGFKYPFQAAGFIRRHPRLIQYVLIPFLINLTVFSAAVYLGLHFFQTTVTHLIPTGEAWYWSLLYYFLWLLAVLVTAVLTFFSFTAVGALIASPFNEILSARTEAILTGIKDDEPFTMAIFLKDAWRTMADEFKKILLFLLAMLILLLLNLLPLFGSVMYSILSIGLTLFFLVVEYTGSIFARKKQSFAQQRHFIFSHKSVCSGFGTGLLLMLAIPFLQFFCIPLGVVGGMLLYNDASPPGEKK